MLFVEHDGGRSKYYKGSKEDDCSIRALALGTGTDYKQVWEELCDISKCSGFFMNSKKVWIPWLEQQGFTEHKLPKPYKETAAILEKNCVVYNRVGYGVHLTAIVDGDLYDTWDCRDRIAYAYWTKETA